MVAVRSLVRRVFPLLALAAVALLVLPVEPARAQDGDDLPSLTAGEPRQITFQARGAHLQQFRIEVPENALAMRIELANLPHDFDLFVRYGQPISRPGEEDIRSATMRRVEQVTIRRAGRPALQAGSWYILVENVDRRAGTCQLTVEIESGGGGTDNGTGNGNGGSPDDGIPPLTAGVATPFRLPGVDKDYIQFRFDVPATAQSVRFEIAGAGEVDLDLYAKIDRPFRETLREATWVSNRESTNEVMVINSRSNPKLQPGHTIYVAVHDYPRAAVNGTLTATVDGELTGITELVAGQFVEVKFDGTANAYRFVFNVGPDIESVRFELEVTDIDVDLFIKHGAAMMDRVERDLGSENESDADERIDLRREYTNAYALKTGAWHVLVWNYENKPTTVRLVVTTNVPPPGALVTEADKEITPGEALNVTLPYKGRHYVMYKVAVPEGTESMAVRTSGGGEGQDIDLYVHPGEPPTAIDAAKWESREEQSEEVVFLAGSDLVPGDYFIIVHSYEGKPAEGTVRVDLNTEAPVTGQVDGNLEPGQPFPITFPHPDGDRAFYTLTFRIPEEAKSATLRVAGAELDVDLFIRYRMHVQSWSPEGTDFMATSPNLNEVFWFDRDTGMRTGLYYVDVRALGESDTTASITLRLDAERPDDYQPSGPEAVEVVPLEIGVAHPVVLDRRQQKYSRFTVVVPEGATALVITLTGANADVDLYARYDQPVGDWELPNTWDYRENSSRVDEQLIIRTTPGQEGQPPLRPGTWFIDAVVFPADPEVRYTILATLDEAPPDAELRMPPFRPMSELSATARAVDACVRLEVEGGHGSGTVVSPTGYILTALHVVGDMQTGEAKSDIFVAFTDSDRDSPRQTHMATMVASVKELDLALLKIDRTVRGDPIDPAKTRFTWLPIGDSTRLRIGDSLNVFGFPAIGGEASRQSITLTRGVVSGFESRGGQTWWLKTDADISPGNSGGTVCNPAGEWVGMPSIVIHRNDAILAFCRPGERLPAEWLSKIKADLPR